MEDLPFGLTKYDIEDGLLKMDLYHLAQKFNNKSPLVKFLIRPFIEYQWINIQKKRTLILKEKELYLSDKNKIEIIPGAVD